MSSETTTAYMEGSSDTIARPGNDVVQSIETDEDRDKIGGGGYQEDVFGIFSVGRGSAKLGIIWSEVPCGGSKLGWQLSFTLVEDGDVDEVLLAPHGVLTRPEDNAFSLVEGGLRRWTCRQHRLMCAIRSGQVLMRLEKSPRAIKVEEIDSSGMNEFLQRAQSEESCEMLFALCLKALSVSRERPNVFLVFSRSRQATASAAPWLQAMIDLQVKRRRTEGILDQDPVEVSVVEDTGPSDNCDSDESDSSIGSHGVSPGLGTSWRSESKSTHDLFKLVRSHDVQKVEELLRPMPELQASQTGIDQCMICRQALAADDAVGTLTCHLHSGCPSVFHAWCGRKWLNLGMLACQLCRSGTLASGTFQDINFKALDGDGFGLLHHACYATSNTQMLKTLLKWGCDANHENGLQERALHMAAMYRHAEHVEILLAAGANAAATDYSGTTALARAEQSMMGLNFNRDSEADKKRCIALLSFPGVSSAALEKGLQLRDKGNEAFKNHNFQQALLLYSEAIGMDARSSKTFANRAAVFLELGRLAETNPEKRSFFSQCGQDATRSIQLDPGFEKAYYRLTLAQIGLKDFPGALIAIEHGLVHCSKSAVLRKLGSVLKKFGVTEKTINPLISANLLAEAQSKIASGCPTTECVWCKVLLPSPCGSSCANCACDPSGQGVGDLANQYGLEWKEEGSAKENYSISEALLGNTGQTSMDITCLEFSRAPRGFHEALCSCAELRSCRQEFADKGLSNKLPSGAHIFVHAEHFDAVVEAARVQMPDLRSRHVLTSAEFEGLVLRAISKLPSSWQVKMKSRQVTAMQSAAHEEAQEDEECESEDEHPSDEDSTKEQQKTSEAPQQGPQTAELARFQDRHEVPYVVKRTFITVPVKSSIYSGSSSGRKTVSTSDADPRFRNPRAA